MASCNPYESPCGLSGTQVFTNPYFPDDLLFNQYIIVNFDTGDRTIVTEEIVIGDDPKIEDELVFSYAIVPNTIPIPEPVPEPPIAGLVLVAYFLYWIVRK